jgi:hypothetical protein
MGGREAGEGEDVRGGGLAEHAPDLGELAPSLPAMTSSCSRTMSICGRAKMVRIAAATIAAEPFGPWASMLRRKSTRQTPTVNLSVWRSPAGPAGCRGRGHTGADSTFAMSETETAAGTARVGPVEGGARIRCGARSIGGSGGRVYAFSRRERAA